MRKYDASHVVFHFSTSSSFICFGKKTIFHISSLKPIEPLCLGVSRDVGVQVCHSTSSVSSRLFSEQNINLGKNVMFFDLSSHCLTAWKEIALKRRWNWLSYPTLYWWQKEKREKVTARQIVLNEFVIYNISLPLWQCFRCSCTGVNEAHPHQNKWLRNNFKY